MEHNITQATFINSFHILTCNKASLRHYTVSYSMSRHCSTQYEALYRWSGPGSSWSVKLIRASGQKRWPSGPVTQIINKKPPCHGEERADKRSLVYAAPLGLQVHSQKTKTVVLTGENGPLTHLSPPSFHLTSLWLNNFVQQYEPGSNLISSPGYNHTYVKFRECERIKI